VTIRYLSLQEILAIHQESITRFGGTLGVRDQGALEAAVARPQTGYYSDMIEEAAALWESLSQNHPFLDGNKRTAITATAVFLRINGYRLAFNDLEAYQWLITLYETGGMRKDALDGWLRTHAVHVS
jgi:death-on-curing protein